MSEKHHFGAKPPMKNSAADFERQLPHGSMGSSAEMRDAIMRSDRLGASHDTSPNYIVSPRGATGAPPHADHGQGPSGYVHGDSPRRISPVYPTKARADLRAACAGTRTGVVFGLGVISMGLFGINYVGVGWATLGCAITLAFIDAAIG